MTDLSAALARQAQEQGPPTCPCSLPEQAYLTTWDATGEVWSKRCMYCGTRLVKDGVPLGPIEDPPFRNSQGEPLACTVTFDDPKYPPIRFGLEPPTD